MAKKERPAQQQGNGGNGGGGYDAQWQPQHQQQGGEQQQQQQQQPPQAFQPPSPSERVQYEAAPGRFIPTVHPQGMPQQSAPPPMTPDQLLQFERSPGSFMDFHRSWKQPSFPPAPAGSTPTGVNGLQVPLPIGTKATHFSGPLVSGGIPQTPVWPDFATEAVGGSAMLTATLSLDFSMGNFTVPVQFPTDSLITGYAMATAVQFTSPPSFQLGTTSGASDIATGSLPAPGGPTQFQPASGQLPLWNALLPQRPFLAYLTIAGNTGGTTGLGFILIQFMRIPQRWT